MVKVGIIGATGYAGAELVRILLNHKEAQIEWFGSRSYIDENYADTPRYIDIFNNLKEDLGSQMKRVVESKDDAKVALFKNSFKTINALEYVLFNDKDISKREKELSVVILDSIISNLEEINKVYKNY
jgi:N-acetyl-gamma-glutamylphosphate reductase